MGSVLKQTSYSVKSEGGLVTLTVGNVPITMDYNTALDISQFLSLEGKRAKRMSGDNSKTWRNRGILTDRNADELEMQSLRDPTASFK